MQIAPSTPQHHAGHTGGGGHGDHHTPGKVFPGQPPAWVLPKSHGPGVVQPPDVVDTAKGEPLPHWDGVLLGAELVRGADGGTQLQNLYVNGAFNYMDHVGTEATAIAELQKLTAGPDRPAAVLWRDKFGILHGQALLTFGGMNLATGQSLGSAAPVAAQLGAETLNVSLGHPEALAIIDGDMIFRTNVPSVVPIEGNGAQWPEPKFPL